MAGKIKSRKKSEKKEADIEIPNVMEVAENVVAAIDKILVNKEATQKEVAQKEAAQKEVDQGSDWPELLKVESEVVGGPSGGPKLSPDPGGGGDGGMPIAIGQCGEPVPSDGQDAVLKPDMDIAGAQPGERGDHPGVCAASRERGRTRGGGTRGRRRYSTNRGQFRGRRGCMKKPNNAIKMSRTFSDKDILKHRRCFSC